MGVCDLFVDEVSLEVVSDKLIEILSAVLIAAIVFVAILGIVKNIECDPYLYCAKY